MDTMLVYIFKPWEKTPTYHDYGGIADDNDVTKCGLVMYDGATRETRYGARLRRDHADLFARPCRTCFGHGSDPTTVA